MKLKKLKILYATAEVEPISKAGGLGDVAGSLPIALKRKDVDIRLITPLYGFINRTVYRIRKVAGLTPIKIQVGEISYSVQFFRSNLPGTKVQIFFVKCDELFGMHGIYSDPETGHGFKNNPTRFILFSKAIIAFLDTGAFSPNLIHLNDNQTALVAPMLKTIEANKKHSGISTLLTIHNAEYQGHYDKHYIYQAGLDYKQSTPGKAFEFYGGFNFLKAGIVFADKINTVSKTYRTETTMSAEYAFGLEGVLNEKQNNYLGILNGVDYTKWNPKYDRIIPKRFSKNNISGKFECKKELLKRAGFKLKYEDDFSKPLIGIVSRLVSQKGIDILIEALPSILANDLNFVLLGTGDKYYHKKLEHIQAEYAERFGLFLTFNEELAHLIVAGSDMLLMPSKFEPCGLNQLYAMKYGTVPIVRQTGGLADTVKDFCVKHEKGCGFVFKGYSADELSAAIYNSTRHYQDKEIWQTIIKRCMTNDFSWSISASEYKKLYSVIVNGQ